MSRRPSGPSGNHKRPRRLVGSAHWPAFDNLARRAGVAPSTILTRLIEAMVTDEEAALGMVRLVFKAASKG